MNFYNKAKWALPKMFTRSNHWFYSLLIDKEKYGLSRDELLNKLNDNKIQTRPIWGLVHDQNPYKNNQTYRIEKANYYIDRILNIPCSTNLIKEDVEYVCKTLRELKR
jgi:perosamine synthetase